LELSELGSTKNASRRKASISDFTPRVVLAAAALEVQVAPAPLAVVKSSEEGIIQVVALIRAVVVQVLIADSAVNPAAVTQTLEDIILDIGLATSMNVILETYQILVTLRLEDIVLLLVILTLMRVAYSVVNVARLFVEE